MQFLNAGLKLPTMGGEQDVLDPRGRVEIQPMQLAQRGPIEEGATFGLVLGDDLCHPKPVAPRMISVLS